MDDSAMNHILEATGFPAGETRMHEAAGAAVRADGHFSWERFIRCLTLCAVVLAAGYMAWRPAVLRFSQLLFLVSPSRAENLNVELIPETEAPPVRFAARKQTPEPPEWRPGSTAQGNWRLERRAADEEASWRGAGILPVRWRRLSGNPWNWRDDSTARLRRGELPQPPQKAESAFRVKEDEAWGEEADLSELPPLSLDAIDIAAKPEEPAAPAAPETTAATEAEPAKPEPVDWKNEEITAAIPGAYLTIYPGLKFIGLCVPGQGYIRKYNQVGVPRDAAGGKMSADDGLTPYGKYYITARTRDADGTRLELSWPSPEDAARIGLGAPERMAVEEAWRNQALPPQDTTAGGGVALVGLQDVLENTDGGFALEPHHMEEIAAALSDGAWVFIQE